jgi:hypothetical protein
MAAISADAAKAARVHLFMALLPSFALPPRPRADIVVGLFDEALSDRQ